MMKHKLIDVLLTSLLALAGVPVIAEEARPNIVLIVADDLGWADLGCYGSRFYRTPNLDRLAAGGRRFVQAYSACPVCSPTRAALMTGKHPARLHLTDWLPGRPDMPAQKLLRPVIRQELPLEEITIAEALKAAGYATAHIGKWHLGGVGFEPTRQGFDLNIAGDASGTALSYWAPFARNGRTMPGLAEAPAGQYLTDRLTIEAERFIEAHRAEPFFLYMPHYAVHTPITAKADLIARYPRWDGTPHGRQENPIYAAMIESLDESVGRIVAKLETLGLASKTIVIFTSDNGGLATREGPNTPPTINAPLREGKGWLYEGGVRVPLLVRWPDRIKPGVDNTPVWSADVLPTVLELSGQPRLEHLDGVSLAGLLTEGKPLATRALYWHYPHYSNQNGARPGGSIRDGDWKLIEGYETGRRELYNLGRDMSETTNLVEREPKKVEELAAKLAEWRKDVVAQMNTLNPDYSPNAQGKNGVVVLPARTAEVHGVMLRYEPLAHKNTLGFWVRVDDWASWEFDVRQPGEFAVDALVGCGTGSGGSMVEFRLGDQVLKLTVPETGGFQKFEPQPLGRVSLARAGRYRLEVRAISKPGPAVMDLRELILVPEAKKAAGRGTPAGKPGLVPTDVPG
jgi:arylsulfatase A